MQSSADEAMQGSAGEVMQGSAGEAMQGSADDADDSLITPRSPTAQGKLVLLHLQQRGQLGVTAWSIRSDQDSFMRSSNMHEDRSSSSGAGYAATWTNVRIPQRYSISDLLHVPAPGQHASAASAVPPKRVERTATNITKV